VDKEELSKENWFKYKGLVQEKKAEEAKTRPENGDPATKHWVRCEKSWIQYQ